MPQDMIVIERRSDGYAPPMRTINRVLKIGESRGFRVDWEYVGVLETGALCFSRENDISALVAIKLSGKYCFMTEREYYALKLP